MKEVARIDLPRQDMTRVARDRLRGGDAFLVSKHNALRPIRVNPIQKKCGLKVNTPQSRPRIHSCSVVSSQIRKCGELR